MNEIIFGIVAGVVAALGMGGRCYISIIIFNVY